MNPKSSSERLAESLKRARRHWQSRGAATESEVPGLSSRPAFTIAISREAGANGPAIAHRVGECLGWPVYDQELLQRIAEEMGLRTSLLQSVDEKHTGWLRECVEALAAVPAVSEGAYARHLTETLFSLAAHGECVILGRGGAQVLPRETTLRVRLVGPVEDRIAVIRDRFGISNEEARTWVERTDAARDRFVKDHYRKDPADPRHYDLVLNSTRFSVVDCAELIVAAHQRIQSRSGEPAAAMLVH